MGTAASLFRSLVQKAGLGRARLVFWILAFYAAMSPLVLTDGPFHRLAHLITITYYRERFDYVSERELNIPVDHLLRAHDRRGYADLRQKVTGFIYADGRLPTTGADMTDPEAAAPWILPKTPTISFTMQLPSNLTSKGYLLRAPTFRSCLFLYHFGHGEGYRDNYDTVSESYKRDPPEPGVQDLANRMLTKGCDVVFLSMPLSGDNHTDPGLDPTEAHNRLGEQQTDTFSPLQYFLEPVSRAITYADGTRRHRLIAMAGKSGGGWTATVAAAIDPRIQHIFSISGTMPLYLRALRSEDVGDWEQSRSPLWSHVGYLDMYILNALEQDRTALHIWRRYDSCCFAGRRAYYFFPRLIAAADRIGVSGLDFFVDEDPYLGHELTDEIVRRIDGDMAKFINAAAPGATASPGKPR